ncbi:uncharacterized protein TNCT_307442 [Trichonephila clavata]|nr:uncharacterized protein TNCT_307442 [Trichonephila clavata]
MDETEAGAKQEWLRKEFMLDGTHIRSIKHSSLYLNPLNAEQKFFSTNVRQAEILPFSKWENLVEEKLLSFLLPKCLFPLLIELTRMVSIEIDKWIKDLSLILERSAEIAHTSQRYFQWNSLGKIDRTRTARMLIMNEGSNMYDLYILAVHYNLLDDVLIDNNTRRRLEEVAEHGQFSRICIHRQYWRQSAGENDILFAPQNSWTEALHLNLVSHSVQYPDLLFGLAQMGPCERKELFESSSFFILLLLLNWPLQGQFLNASELLLPYLSKDNYYILLRIILYERIMLSRKDFNYFNLLKGFWYQSTVEFKEFVKTKSIYEPLMFTMNYSNERNFPNEKLFESDFNNRLTFQYQGIKYCLFRTDRIFVRRMQIFTDLIYPRYIEEFSFLSQKRKIGPPNNCLLNIVGF